MRSRSRPLILALALLAAASGRAVADEEGRIILLEENDSLYFNSDKHYTQGLRLSDLRPALAPDSAGNGPFNFVHEIAPILFQPDGDQGARRYAFFFGQSVFTPKNLTLKPPDPHDRPYGGWLYAGVSLLQESDRRMLENLELDVGVVGPMALGKQVQNNWHQLIGKEQAQGWSSQIQNEPGGVLSYERSWRFPLTADPNTGVDVVPQLGASLGNVFTYGEAGAQIRIGRNLQSDYGQVHIRPALSGTDYFTDPTDGKLGYYFFLGAQGRAVGHNIFLDGNTFRQSPHVSKKALVADLQAGFSVFWGSCLRLDFSVVRRTEEFVGQHTPDEIGTAALAFSW
jgi:hypothetical protein